jgi:hypothetical protein
MRKKRLQHIADIFCHMFCGWQTFFDYNQIVNLGSGRLDIDVLTGICNFNGERIEQLSISEGLQQWLKTECRTNKIDITHLLQAKLAVDLHFSIIQWTERQHSINEVFFVNGKIIETDKMHKCDFSCKSMVQTDEKIYTSEYHRTREWPFGWPK